MDVLKINIHPVLEFLTGNTLTCRVETRRKGFNFSVDASFASKQKASFNRSQHQTIPGMQQVAYVPTQNSLNLSHLLLQITVLIHPPSRAQKHKASSTSVFQPTSDPDMPVLEDID